MTKRHFAAGIGLLIIVVGSAVGWREWARWSKVELPAAGVAAALDPDRPMVMYVDGMAPSRSTTLADMVRDADAVLVVQLLTDVTERRVVDTWPGGLKASKAQSPMQRLASPAPPPFHYTVYSFYVHQAIKGAMKRGDSVRIARRGGRQTYEDNFPRPGVGEKFVVFLEGEPHVGAYQHLYGPVSSFRIVYGRVCPMGHLFEKQSGRSEDEFVRELQAIAAKQQGG